ncbi:hypothetical protein GQ44DRAFT_823597 [Phaeosphaeriaceae sp. PMI808]|nr:hypothetical protein GQ44DRAFT_823597 [Phaeosphaeriaceae sp. PMI808]
MDGTLLRTKLLVFITHKLPIPQYKDHLENPRSFAQSCAHNSDLANEILPMFLNRWVTGPGQYNHELSRRIEPALRLASLFLTDEYTLAWACRLTYGERHVAPSGTYIDSNASCRSPAALAQVKKNIRDVGTGVTFLFILPEHADGNVNASTPPSPCLGYGCPVIAMDASFRKYFGKPDPSNKEEYFRGLFVFFVTLLHEFTHATWMAVGTIDAGVCFHKISSINRPFHHLLRFDVKEHGSTLKRERALHSICSNGSKASFTTADANGNETGPPIWDADKLDACTFHHVDDMTENSYFAGVQVIPIDWIVRWFKRDYWDLRRRAWARSDHYITPSLQDAFMLLYERSRDRAYTLRPPNPALTVDKKILDRRADGDSRL